MQVLMNLITNARDALNERYPDYEKNKRVRVSSGLLEAEGQSWIRTTIEDQGNGIPVEIMDCIFDPFFSSKPCDKGTGLGLSISHSLVKDHQGNIIVESEPGQYTRFHIDIPIAETPIS